MPLVPAEHRGRENTTTRITAKTVTNLTEIHKRTALGDLGNKLLSQTWDKKAQLQKNETKTIMGPPQALPKKTVPIKTTVLNANKPTVTKKPTTTAVSKNTTRDTTVINTKKPSTKPTAPVKVWRNPVLSRTASSSSITSETCASYSSKQLNNVLDPDADTKDEPQHVTEYLPAIFSYLRELERKYEIQEDYLNDHKITVKMRTILINWLVDVHLSFKMQLETLQMCITLIDRFLQVCRQIGKDSLQLVGVTALLIAAKYEEMYMPDLFDFVYVCDNAFTKEEILQMERKILKTLEFNITRPHSIQFLRRYSKCAQAGLEKHVLGKYLLELAMMEFELAHVRPSVQAAAACCLAIAVMDEVLNPSSIWTPTLIHYTTYKYADFKNVVYVLARLLLDAKTTKFNAVYCKYASSKNCRISLNSKIYNSQMVKKLAGIVKKTQTN